MEGRRGWEPSSEMPAAVLDDSPGTGLCSCKSCPWVCTAPGLHWGLTGAYRGYPIFTGMGQQADQA